VAPGYRLAAGIELSHAVVTHRDLFDRHDRVAASRQHRAGHHFEAVGSGSERERCAARRLDACNTEAAPAFRAERECDAVHGHAVEGRRVALCVDRLAQGSSGAGGEGNALDRHRRDGRRDRRIGLGRRQHARARVSSACRGP
jgi:hypothetical protein